MRKKAKNPLMLAYIFFLVIALLYHVVADMVDFEFEAWQRIIVAVTIASYAFSLGSLRKSTIKYQEMHLKLLNEYLPLVKKLKKKESAVLSEGTDKDELLQLSSKTIENTTKLISDTESAIEKNEKNAFALDVIGYLMFFCIMVFDAVFTWFYSSQDTYTVLAFLLILIKEYVESSREDRYNNLFNALVGNVQETIKKLEEQENG